MDIYTPTNFRKNLFSILKDVNQDSKQVTITKANGDGSESAVIMSKRDWEAYQETYGPISQRPTSNRFKSRTRGR